MAQQVAGQTKAGETTGRSPIATERGEMQMREGSTNYDGQNGVLVKCRIEEFDGEIRCHPQFSRAGVQQWADGSSYNGQFLDVVRDGKVMQIRHGQGTVSDANGKILYYGQFWYDKMHGKGAYYFPNGRRYFGDWDAGYMHGEGVMQWPNHCKYVGSFESDLRHGEGAMIWSDGSQLIVEWSRGKQHGLGLLIDADGRQSQQVFMDGVVQPMFDRLQRSRSAHDA